LPLFHLPASKSESNRALIVQALAGGGTIANLSEANDTQLLARLLALPPDTPAYDCEDAGTTLRFLTALAAVQGRTALIHGTARMHQRPIGPLVEALRTLGATIEYVDQPGFPPLQLTGFRYTGTAEVAIPANVSSQFISALLLVAPALPHGLTVRLLGAVASAPYLHLTADVLRQWGATVEFLAPDAVRVGPGGLRPTAYMVEADWSAASYAYALAALAPPGFTLTVEGLNPLSRQGDRVIHSLLAGAGVKAEFVGSTLHLAPTAVTGLPGAPLDFTDCPDLAQTVAVVLAAQGLAATFVGVQSLRVKETDRLAALQTELARFGADFQEGRPGEWRLEPGDFRVENQLVRTYHDHRMALAFAPLALRGPIRIENPMVVRKSFPRFWEELRQLGLEVPGA
jgi:3-phosphoshikimate 1-carboxyvinyltransferase